VSTGSKEIKTGEIRKVLEGKTRDTCVTEQRRIAPAAEWKKRREGGVGWGGGPPTGGQMLAGRGS